LRGALACAAFLQHNGDDALFGHVFLLHRLLAILRHSHAGLDA
jgi:hypothetical protein